MNSLPVSRDLLANTITETHFAWHSVSASWSDNVAGRFRAVYMEPLDRDLLETARLLDLVAATIDAASREVKCSQNS